MQQRLAESQALAQEGVWLEELKPLVLQGDPNAAVAMLQLREARLAAAAARAEANLACDPSAGRVGRTDRRRRGGDLAVAAFTAVDRRDDAWRA